MLKRYETNAEDPIRLFQLMIISYVKKMLNICWTCTNQVSDFQYPSLFTVDGEWVSITQTIKVRFYSKKNKKNCQHNQSFIFGERKPKFELIFADRPMVWVVWVLWKKLATYLPKCRKETIWEFWSKAATGQKYGSPEIENLCKLNCGWRHKTIINIYVCGGGETPRRASGQFSARHLSYTTNHHNSVHTQFRQNKKTQNWSQWQ